VKLSVRGNRFIYHTRRRIKRANAGFLALSQVVVCGAFPIFVYPRCPASAIAGFENSDKGTLSRSDLFKRLSVPSLRDHDERHRPLSAISAASWNPAPPSIKKRRWKYLDPGFPSILVSRASGEEARTCLSWRPFAGKLSHAVRQALDQATYKEMIMGGRLCCVQTMNVQLG
jgi:hypothetical protein